MKEAKAIDNNRSHACGLGYGVTKLVIWTDGVAALVIHILLESASRNNWKRLGNRTVTRGRFMD